MKRVLLLVSLIFSLRSMDRDEEIKSVLIGKVLIKGWVENPQTIGNKGIIGRLCLLDLEFMRHVACYRIVKIVGKETDGYYSLQWREEDSFAPLLSHAGSDLYELNSAVLEILRQRHYFQ